MLRSEWEDDPAEFAVEGQEEDEDCPAQRLGAMTMWDTRVLT